MPGKKRKAQLWFSRSLKAIALNETNPYKTVGEALTK